MAYTNVWSDTVPTGAEAANTIDDIFRSLKVDVEQRFNDIFGGMPSFATDPLRPYGLRFTDAQDAVIFLGNNAGTPRYIFVKDSTGTASYLSFGFTGITFNGNSGISANVPFLDLSQTWNNAAVAFTGIRVNIIDTASNTNSLFINFQVGGSSQFNVTKAGSVQATNFLILGSQVLAASNFNTFAPTLTGTGASGTWGISVTGTSANITAFLINQNLATTSNPSFNSVTTAGNASIQGGIVYLNAAGTSLLFWDGTQYNLPNADLFINGSKALHAANFNTFAPTLTGTGASGTWGINISGNAATATAFASGFTFNQNLNTTSDVAFNSVTVNDANNTGKLLSSSSSIVNNATATIATGLSGTSELTLLVGCSGTTVFVNINGVGIQLTDLAANTFGTLFTRTSGNAGTMNIFVSAGVLTIENKTGSTQVYTAFIFGKI